MDSENTYISKLKVYTIDNDNNMLPIITKASLKNVVVTNINEFKSDNKLGFNLTIKVKNKDDLEAFKESIRILPFVVKVELDN